MALRDAQAKMVELGRVRTGQRVMNRAGTKLIPKKLDSFRFTSPAEHLIKAIAALYGGTVEPFTGEGVVGKQFGVITDVDDIPIYLPQQKIDPFYEQWKGGVCVRRCDGERDMIHDKPCDCASGEDRLCKPTTRVNLMLADVPGIGVWRLESHGIYAAMELSQLAFLLERPRAPIPARLILELRQRKFFNQKKREVEVRDYYVPVVMVDAVTSRHVVMGGDALSQALRMSEGAPALESAPSAPALSAAPTGPDPAVIERGLAFIAQVQPDGVADARARVAKMGNPAVLVEALEARVGALASAAEQMPEAPVERGELVAELLARLRDAARHEMDALRERIRELGAPDPLVAAWKQRMEVHVTELRQRIATAAPEGMNVLWGEVEKLGSPELLVREWTEREARHSADEAAQEGFATAWDGEEVAAPTAEVAPAAAELPSEAELAARKAAMMTLLGEAGTRGMKMTAVNALISEKLGKAATDATAAELAALTAELTGATR